MSQHKLGIAVSEKLGIHNLPLIKSLGFDSVFIEWVSDFNSVRAVREDAAKNGLGMSSLHAPFNHVDALWRDTLDGDDVVAELQKCVEDCATLEIPVLVSHPFIGFKDHTPTPIGLARYRKLGEFADKMGVKIAIENVEGEEYLDYLLPNLRDIPSIGFCLDTGHEYCYNKARDMLADYGDLLCYLHINSNMGVTSPDGEITFLDDSHMLPFDGVVSMERLVERLKKINYRGELTTELVKGNRRDRHTNDIYLPLTEEEYLTVASERMKRLQKMLEKF